MAGDVRGPRALLRSGRGAVVSVAVVSVVVVSVAVAACGPVQTRHVVRAGGATAPVTERVSPAELSTEALWTWAFGVGAPAPAPDALAASAPWLRARVLEATGEWDAAAAAWAALLAAPEPKPTVLRLWARTRLRELSDRVDMAPLPAASEPLPQLWRVWGPLSPATHAAFAAWTGDRETLAARVSEWLEAPPDGVSSRDVAPMPGGVLAWPQAGPGLFVVVPLSAPGPSASRLDVQLAGSIAAVRRAARPGAWREGAASVDAAAATGGVFAVIADPARLGVVVRDLPAEGLALLVATDAPEPEVRLSVPSEPRLDAEGYETLPGCLAALSEAEVAVAEGRPGAEAFVRAEGVAGPCAGRWLTAPLAAVWAASYLDARGTSGVPWVTPAGPLQGAVAARPRHREAAAAQVSRRLVAGEPLTPADRRAVARGDWGLRLKLVRAERGALAAYDVARRWVRRRPGSCLARREAARVALELPTRPPEGATELVGLDDVLARCPTAALAAAELAQRWALPERAAELAAAAARSASRPETRLDALLLGARVAAAAGHTAEAAQLLAKARRAGRGLEAVLDAQERLATLAGEHEAADEAREALLHGPHVAADERRRVAQRARDLGLPLADVADRVRQARRARRAGRGLSAPLVVHLDDRHVRVLADGAVLHRRHRLVELVDASAVRLRGEVVLPEDAEVLVARTWKPVPGGVQPLEAEDFLETTTLSLPALEPGALVEVAYVWVQAPRRGLAPGWVVGPFDLGSADGPTVEARVRLVGPPPPAGGARPEVTLAPARGEGVVVTRPADGEWLVEARDLPVFSDVPGDPRPDRRRPTVRVHGAAGGDAWLRALREVEAPRTVAGPEVAAWVAAVGAEGADRDRVDPMRRLRALYDQVLTAVDDVGGARSAEQTAAFGRGDRVRLLHAAASAVGLHSELVHLRPWSRGYEPSPSEDAPVPHPDDWSYPVLRVARQGEALWLDPASPWSPFGSLPPLVRGAAGLVVSPVDAEARVRRAPSRPVPPEGAGVGLDGAPDPSLGGRTQEVDVLVRLDADDPTQLLAVATGQDTVSGAFAMGWRDALAPLDAPARQRLWSRIVARSLAGATLTEVSFGALDVRDQPLVVRWKAEMRVESESPGTWLLALTIAPSRLARGLAPRGSRRGAPVLVGREESLRATLRVRLEPGLAAQGVTRAVAVDAGPDPEAARPGDAWLRYRRAAESGDGGRRWALRKALELGLGLVPPERYDRWVDAALRGDSADALTLTVRRSALGR